MFDGNYNLFYILFIYGNDVYLVGGFHDKKQIQSINFDGVASLNDAKTKTRSILGELDDEVYNVGVIYYHSKLYILSP